MNDKQFFCYGRLKTTGEVIAIRQGEKGYHKTDYGIQSQEFVDDMNHALGVDMVTADAAGLCSLSGNWKAFGSIENELRYGKQKKDGDTMTEDELAQQAELDRQQDARDREAFDRLRMYFRLNFIDGASDRAFLKWCADMCKQSARESLYKTKALNE